MHELQETNISEDISKFHTADTVIFYNQTKDEAKYGLARLVVGKARNEIKETIFISQNYGIGQFCCDSNAYKDSYNDIVKNHMQEIA